MRKKLYIETVFFPLNIGAKKNLKARCYVTKNTSFDATLQHGFGIVLMWNTCFDPQVSYIFDTVSTRKQHRFDIQAACCITKIRRYTLGDKPNISKQNYILRRSIRYIMQLQTIKLYHKAYAFDAILYSRCRSRFYVTSACFDLKILHATRKTL